MAKRKSKAERAAEAQLEIEKEIILANTESPSENTVDEPVRSLEDALKNYKRKLRRL